jgi:hypothetical protein
MNIQELHEKKKAFEMKLVEIIGKELSEFANEGVIPGIKKSSW